MGMSMTDIFYSVHYTDTSPETLCEKHFLTMGAALNFCVQVSALGGAPLDILQLIHGAEDGVLECQALAVSIDRQRDRLRPK
jgi:hypothetical protein